MRQESPPTSQVLRLSQRNEPADPGPATATLPGEFFIIRALGEALFVPDSAAVLDNFTTGAANNHPHRSSADYDRLVSTGASQPDESAREYSLASAEALLLESAVVAPLYFNTKNWLVAPRVRGWREDALWTRFYADLNITER